jgi:tRNA (guanine-N7-)-methyltransferase
VSLRSRSKLPLEALSPYCFTFPPEGQLLDLSTLFAKPQPVEMEVGFGKGAFLIETAPQHPEVNYLGIEIDRGLQLYVANRLAKRGWANVKVAHGDAGKLMAQHLGDGVLQALHIYFPDPWWKKKHRKRRVFNEAFAMQAARLIEPGGLFHIATDVAEYFQVMMTLMAERPEFLPLHVGREERAEDEAAPATNFEKKARVDGRPIWRARFKRA